MCIFFSGFPFFYTITMKSLRKKPPKSVIAFYVRIFCKKKKSMSSREGCIQKALKSWFSLSAAEQQPFVDKFKKCEEIYKQECATYLKTVEPFLKKKAIRDKVNVSIIHEPEENNCESNLQPYADDHHLVEDSSHNLVSRSVSDLDAEELSTGQEAKIETAEEIQILPEPTPPYMKNGKELFEAVNNKPGENNTQWKDLSQIERGKYRNAVLAIKRDYIKNYQNYLESLSSKQLFQHYIKSMEKYLVVILFSENHSRYSQGIEQRI